MTPRELAAYFDHTILKPDATAENVRKICDEALSHHFFSVCVNPVHVGLVREALTGSDVKVCSVVGFPLGANTPGLKALETRQAVKDGAGEIDMVINVGALKSGDLDWVSKDIEAVVTAAKGALVKVIIETCLLSREEKIQACEVSRNAGAHFVKTSTGFAGGGATVEDVALMKSIVGDDLKVKASGGIKNLSDTLDMIKAGADRIGASAGVAIMKEMAE